MAFPIDSIFKIFAFCAIPAFVLSIFPLVAGNTLMPVGNTNADPIIYAIMPEFLRDFGLRDPVPFSQNFPVYSRLRNDR